MDAKMDMKVWTAIAIEILRAQLSVPGLSVLTYM